LQQPTIRTEMTFSVEALGRYLLAENWTVVQYAPKSGYYRSASGGVGSSLTAFNEVRTAW